MDRSPKTRLVPRILSLVAVLFGFVSIIAGTRVLTGHDPGYTVFSPLLIFNTAMGAVYMAAGVIAWRNLHLGKYAAASIFILNLVVLGLVGYLYGTGASVAVESLGAMSFRTVLWCMLFLGLHWVDRSNASAGKNHA